MGTLGAPNGVGGKLRAQFSQSAQQRAVLRKGQQTKLREILTNFQTYFTEGVFQHVAVFMKKHKGTRFLVVLGSGKSERFFFFLLKLINMFCD